MKSRARSSSTWQSRPVPLAAGSPNLPIACLDRQRGRHERQGPNQDFARRFSRRLLSPPATPPTPTTPTPHAWAIAEAIAIHGPIGIGASIGVDGSIGGIAVSTIPVTISPAGRSWLGLYYQKRRSD